MECHEVSDLLSAYIDGELDPMDSKNVANHLSVCSYCRNELSELQQTIDLLHELPDLAPPPDFCLQVMNRIKSEPKKQAWIQSRHWFSFGAVAAAILLFIVSVNVVSPFKSFPYLTETSQEIVADSSPAPAEQEAAGENQLGATLEIQQDSSALIEDSDEGLPFSVEEDKEPSSALQKAETYKTKQDHSLVQNSASASSTIETPDSSNISSAEKSSTPLESNGAQESKNRDVNYRGKKENQIVMTREATTTSFDYNITLHSDKNEQVSQEIRQIVYSLGGNVLDDGTAHLEVAIPSTRIDVAFAALNNQGITEVHHVSNQDVNQTINYLKIEQESILLKINSLERDITRAVSQEKLTELELLVAQQYEELKLTQMRLKAVANGNTIVKICFE